MTEQDLANIETWVRQDAAGAKPNGPVMLTPSPVLLMIAEIRRLRGLLKRAERNGNINLGPCCPWCGAHHTMPHAGPDALLECPAFTPDGEVR